MALAKITGAQRNFAAGEVDASLKRNDENELRKAGGRQMSNWRIKNTGSVANRPGRRALFLESGRVEEILMSPGNTFFLAFGNTYLRVYNSAGSKVFDSGNVMPWTTATLPQIVWDTYKLVVYITFPGNVPQVLTWDGISTWSVANYAETVSANQKRTPFYRLSPTGVTMQPSAASGSVTLTFSSGMNLVAGHVGTRMRYINSQLLITAVADSQHATATVEQQLLPTENFNFTNQQGSIAVGDAVIGSVSKAVGVVVNIGGALMTVQLTQPEFGFFGTATGNADTIVGPNGTVAVTSGIGGGGPGAITLWDDEVMNSFRGYPASCFVDQNRLGLTNFPALPGLIAWSAVGLFTDQYTDVNNVGPDNAIQELAPRKSKVLFVVAGPESSEFVFCDNGVYYIPITATNPLKPGSVAFNLLTSDGCAANVQPRIIQDVIAWVNAGLTSVLAVVAPGAYYRPYEVRNLSELHAHLIKSPVALAVPSSTSQFEERYAYVLNGDGSIAVGKYNVENGQIKGVVGFLPWNSSVGVVNWISALGSDVIFTTTYTVTGASAVSVVEQLDNTQYLESSISVNNVPTALTPPGGKGPLWWLAGGTVQLMDNVTRMMGTYTIDANGNIVPQNNGGENLMSSQLVAGQMWTATLEPFVPDAPPGQSAHQRMFKRRVSRMAAYVKDSTGFLMARLFSGPITPTSPALGTVMNTRRITTWNQGDDPTQAPPLRETVERWRPIGRSFDPRVAIIKDTPGPLEILEIGLEASI